MPHHALAPERLLEHAPALRRLARAILGDAHRAEDAVQETWRLALERPPRDGSGLACWLRRVLVNVCRRELRGSSRRDTRERVVARDEALEAQDEALARAEELRVVVEALVALDEPYRSTLILRYVDELAPGDIARRSGVPLATVKTRLRRGLDRLRSELGAETRGRRRSLPGALLAPALRSPLVWILGGSIVKAKLTAAVAVIVLLAMGLWWVAPGPGAAPLEREVAATPGVVPSAPPSSSSVKDPARAPLAQADPGPAPEAAAGSVHRLVFDVHVLDRDDRPVPGTDIVLAATGLPTQHVGTTDPEGRLHVALRSRTPSLEVWVGLRHGGWPRELVRVELSSRRPGRVTLIAAPVDRVRRVGRESSPALVGLLAGETSKVVIEYHAADLAWLPEAQREDDGALLLVDPFAARQPGDDPPDFAGPGAVIIEGDPSFSHEVMPPERVAGAKASLVGSLADSGGAPAAGALVRVRAGGRNHDARSDAEGRFRFDDLPPGEALLVAGGGVHGMADERLHLGYGQRSHWQPLLDRGLELAGQLVTPHDWSGWYLRAECPQGSFAKEVPLAADGALALPNVPATPLRLLAYPPQRSMQLPVPLAEAVWAASGRVHLDPAPDALAFALVKAELRDALSRPAGAGLLRARHDGGARLLEVHTDGRGRFLLSLPPGSFAFAFGHDASGWTDLGPRALHPGETCDLGTLGLPRPGRLRLGRVAGDAARPPPTFELLRRVGPLDAIVWRGTLHMRLPLDLDLAPGEYSLVLEARQDDFELQPGDALELALD